MTQEPGRETIHFQAEVQQILHLMIHSLYSEREIFLRELISNASDACDRLRFAALTDKSVMDDEGELGIEIEFDKKNRTITVRDNGIGMNRDEVIENIGTIARSGTRKFVESLTGEESRDTRLIGQFGVGFYSVFMVADRVTLRSRRGGLPAAEGVFWESDGSAEFSVSATDKPERGTEVVLQIKKAEKEFLDEDRLRGIIRRYSEHISLPIRLRTTDPDKPDEEAKWETVNKGSALWTRPRKDITEEDYHNFYHGLTYDPEPPVRTIHSHVEGKTVYTSLFFIPAKAPFDLWDREQRHGVKLYVRRIFIMDDTRYLMPAYLRFVRGIVDAADLPLNVSREHLQRNKEIDKIRAGSVKKILSELASMAKKDEENYGKFWEQFGRVLKEGIVEDDDNRKVIADLLRFSSTRDDTKMASLADYTKRMPLKQKAIYYLTADSIEAARVSPHLEVFRKHAIEVLLLTDPIDEWLVGHLPEYDDKPLKSVARGTLDLGEFEDAGEAKAREQQEKSLSDLASRIKAALGDDVKEVRTSHRLTDSPACLIADEHDLGANLRRILEASGQKVPAGKPILELNPDHPIIAALSPEAADIDDWARILLDQATLAEGAPLRSPADYVRRINRILQGAVSPPDTEPLPEPAETK